MDTSGVFEIQSHGSSHKTPEYMNAKQYDKLGEDLLKGKTVLEEKLSKKILHLAWPQGHFDGEGIKTALDIGFEALYTTERGANTADNLSMINRLPVKCKKGRWLTGKLPIYSSILFSRIYLGVRTG